MARNRSDKSTISFLERMDAEYLDPDWNIPTEYPDLTRYNEISIDLETCDPNLTKLGPGWARKDGFIVGIAIAAEGGEKYWYFPIRHKNGNNLDPKITLRWLQKQLATPHMTKVMHNATYDAGWLLAEGVEVQGPIIDTMIAAPLIDENRFSYSLNNLGRDYIAMGKSEKLLRAAARDWGIDPKADMWILPAKFVGPYAEQDAIMTLKLWERFKIEITKQDLNSIFQLETSLIPLMVKMRAKGVAVDLSKAEQVRGALRTKVRDLKAFIKDRSGVDIEPWASESVKQVFDALGIAYPRTEAGAPSFTKAFLNANEHEVARALVKLREFDKADSTFIDSILRHEHNGRIHTEFHQLRSDDGGTVTGRFCVDRDTLIETQRGPVRIVDVKPRVDLAVTHRGRLMPIRHLIYKGVEEMVSLRVSSGQTIKCTGNHRVLTPLGWKQVRELSTGQEIYSVRVEEAPGRPETVGGGGVVLHVLREADDQGSREDLRSNLPYRAGHDQAGPDGRAAGGREAATILPIEDRRLESDVWEGQGRASQLSRSLVLRPPRVCLGAQAGVVHRKDGLEARLRASGCDGRDAGSYGGSGRISCPPHQRGQGGQLSGQFGLGYFGSAPDSSCTVTVEAIEPVGTAQVWDIEVEGDHSYVAHGLIHHNSSSAPNLQQIPARDPEIKAMIRGLFVPEHGEKWGSFDYSSQEPRLLVHFAASLSDNRRHPVVDTIVEEYNRSDVDLHQMVADIAGISRKEAKTVNLGIMYGMGAAKLAGQLDVSVAEAKGLLETHRSKVPFVKQLADIASKQAEKNGQIRTLLGRLCHFHLWEPRSFEMGKPPKPFEEAQKEYGGLSGIRRAYTYKALNRLIQGSAADQTKKAMADCMSEGLVPLLTVHDELCFSVPDQKMADRVQEIMEHGIELKVPSKVDAELGDNWGEVG